MARTLTKPLPKGEAAPALPPVPLLEQDRQVHEAFPSTQSHVLLGRWAVARKYDRWPALVVANQILGGGGFSSRLMTEVREKRGLVYGVSSGFNPMSAKGPFIIQLQTRGSQTQKALKVIRSQLQRFIEEGPTQSEVEDAIANISGGFPLQIDSNAELAGYMSMIGFYGLPADYLSAYRKRIESVDAEAARAAFNDVIGGRPKVEVIVGGSRGGGRLGSPAPADGG